jgi:TonB family protein
VRPSCDLRGYDGSRFTRPSRAANVLFMAEFRAVALLGSMLVALATAALSRDTKAQTTPPAAVNDATIIPPQISSNANVRYPSDASGDAVVILIITVNRDGTVRASRAIEGRDPFASAAVEACSSWRFTPATRNGIPIAATIRFEVKFVAPPPEPEQPALAPSPSVLPRRASSPPSHERLEPIEVVVRGEQRPPGRISLPRSEVRQLPGAFGDPFRAIEALPGVTPIATGLPFFYVRGAPPGNIGYFLDGVRVPYLFHVGLGPSVVNPALVDRVDLYAGGYPARFGRFTGGIVAGETTAPRTDSHGEGNLRLFDIGGMVETGFAGGDGTVLLSGRYSYSAALLSLVAPDVKLDYRDYQARVTYALTPADRLTVFAFGSYDLLGLNTPAGLRILFGSEFYRLDLRYDRELGAEDRLRVAVTLGWDQTRVDIQRNARDRMLATRAEFVQRLGPAALLRTGADATLNAYDADTSRYTDPNGPVTESFNSTFPGRTDLAVGAWLDLPVELTSNIDVTPGLRIDLFRSGGAAAPALDARLAGTFQVTDDVKINHAYGIVHQPPSFIVPVPGLVPGELRGGLQSSLQASAGVEVRLPESMTVSTTLFQNAFFNMSDALGSGQGDLQDTFDQRSLGSSYGMELYLRRAMTRHLGGYLSYTLSRSMRSLGRERFPSAFDRAHVASGALAFDLGRRWRAGTRLVFYTGVPKTPSLPEGLILPLRTSNPERERPFYRLDLRFEKRWRYGEHAWLAFVAEVMNATLNRETIQNQQIGPVTIPSVGLEGAF